MAQTMRPADRFEVWASSLVRPDEALTASLNLSALAWSALVDGIPVCMFGAAAVSPLSKKAIPWFLASTGIERHHTLFLRHSRPQLEAMTKRFPVLSNTVDARNHAAIRWLKWLGFTVHPAIPFGPFNLPFHPFELRRTPNV
jgi:hypothetical protein